MSITANTRRIQYTQTSVAQAFAVPFYFIAAADLTVIRTRDGVDTTLANVTDYAVTNAGTNPSTAVVTMVAGVNGDIVTIYGNMDVTQPNTWIPNDRFPAATTETTFDRMTMMLQQFYIDVKRTLRLPPSKAELSALPAPTWKNKMLGFDANGTPTPSDPVGASSLTGTVIEVSSYSALRAVSVTGLVTGRQAYVSGYSSSADGADGLFTYNSVSSATDDNGLVLAPSVGSGRWIRNFTRAVHVKWFGAKADGATDDFAAIQAAISSVPSGGVVLCSPGNHVISDTLVCGPVNILGTGSSTGVTTSFTTSAGFTAGDTLIQITGGRGGVKDINIDMATRGGTAIKFVGEGGENYVLRNRIANVASGYWGLHFDNPAGVVGSALNNVFWNSFYNFGTGANGGGIFFDGGGDSNNIRFNVLQLVNSGGHILKYNGVSGAACMDFSNNNASGAAKFIQLNSSAEFKLTKNQLEATTAITNAASAMIEVVGPTVGYVIADNNLNGHTNCTNAVYLNDADDGYVINNSMLDVTNAIEATANCVRCTFLPSYGVTTVSDPTFAIAICYPHGTTTWYGSLIQRATAIINKINKPGVLNWFWGNISGNDFGVYSDASGGTENLWITAGGKVGINTRTPAAQFAVNGGLHVGGTSDPGDNNLTVDGQLVVAGTSAHTLAGPLRVTSASGLSLGNDVGFDRIVAAGASTSKFVFVDAAGGLNGIEVNRVRVGAVAVSILAGAGSPEGGITAPVGSVWQRSDGGAVTSIYIKESGAGNTGWVAK